MRLCLLKADYVNDEFLETHGDLPDMFHSFLATKLDAKWDVFEIRFGEFPSRPAHYDAIFITGSRYSVNQGLDWVEDAKHFIQSASEKITLIGHCFGHQLLAAAFGGVVGKLPKGQNVGLRTIRLPECSELGTFKETRLDLLFNHGEGVTKLPLGAKLLAGDCYCPVQVALYRQNALGIQAHPEYSCEYQEALMDLNQHLDLTQREEAKSRNQSPADVSLAADVICNFIGSGITPGEGKIA